MSTTYTLTISHLTFHENAHNMHSRQLFKMVLKTVLEDKATLQPLPLTFDVANHPKEAIVWRQMGLVPPVFPVPLAAKRPHSRARWLHLPVAVTPFFVALSRADTCPGMAASLGQLLPQAHAGQGVMFSLHLALCNMIELGQVAAVGLVCRMLHRFGRGIDCSLPFCIASRHARFAALFPALSARLATPGDTIHHGWAPVMLALAPSPFTKHQRHVRGVRAEDMVMTMFSPATPVTKAMYKALLQCGAGPAFNPNVRDPVYGCSLLQCLLHRGMFEEAHDLITVYSANVNFVTTCGVFTRTTVSSIPPLDIALRVS